MLGSAVSASMPDGTELRTPRAVTHGVDFLEGGKQSSLQCRLEGRHLIDAAAARCAQPGRWSVGALAVQRADVLGRRADLDLRLSNDQVQAIAIDPKHVR
jgi:hypothetical protein